MIMNRTNYGQPSNEFIEAVNSQKVYEKYKIVTPLPNELQIDIDSEEDLNIFSGQWNLFLKMIPSATYTQEVSVSGFPHYHITIRLPEDIDLEPLTRIALQACLGSDLTRELFSINNLVNGDKYPTIFLEKKEDNDTIKSD